MARIDSKIPAYPQKVIKLQVDAPDLDLATARQIAKRKASEFSAEAMLLAWHNGRSGESHPRYECGGGNRPGWIVFAESRGGNLVIDINDGDYTFIFLRI
jgi:hypothetical protein